MGKNSLVVILLSLAACDQVGQPTDTKLGDHQSSVTTATARSWVIPADQFLVTSGSGQLIGGAWRITTPTATLEAPLVLQLGDTVSVVREFFIRPQDPHGNTFNLAIKSRVLDDGLAGDPVTVAHAVAISGPSWPSMNTVWMDSLSGSGLPYTPPAYPAGDTMASTWIELSINNDDGATGAIVLGVGISTEQQ